MSVTCCRSVVFGGYSSFLHQYNWPSLYDWNIIESGFKHHSHNPIYWPLDCVNILLLITFFLLWTIFLVFILHRNSHRTHICTYLETSWIVINKSEILLKEALNNKNQSICNDTCRTLIRYIDLIFLCMFTSFAYILLVASFTANVGVILTLKCQYRTSIVTFN